MQKVSNIVQAPVTNVALSNNQVVPIETASIKSQEQAVAVFTSQSNFSNIFSTNDSKLDFSIPPNTSSIHQCEKISLMLELQATYPAAQADPNAYQLPPVHTFINRLELRCNQNLEDTIWSESFFMEKMFDTEEDLANDAIVELFDPVDFSLSKQFPALYVNQTGATTDATVQNFRVFLRIRPSYLTSKGYLWPTVKDINTLRFFFKPLSQINVTTSTNNLDKLVLTNAELYCSGIKYSDDELSSLLANDYKNTFICQTMFRRYNISDLVIDTNTLISNNLPTSFMRGRFLCVAFFIQQKNAKGEQCIQYRLTSATPNPGVQGVISSVQPKAFASEPNLNLVTKGYNYSYIPDSLSIDTFQFLDSSSNPVYVSDIRGDMLRNVISNSNSQSDYLFNYAIYPFMFTSEPQQDYFLQHASSGSKFIDGLFALRYKTKYNINGLTDESAVPLRFNSIGCGLQLGHVEITNGSTKFVRYDN